MRCITEIFLNLHICFRCDMMFKISDIIAFCKPVSAVIVPCSNHVYSYWFKHEQCNLNLNPQSCFGNLLMPIVLKVCGVSARLQAVSWWYCDDFFFFFCKINLETWSCTARFCCSNSFKVVYKGLKNWELSRLTVMGWVLSNAFIQKKKVIGLKSCSTV